MFDNEARLAWGDKSKEVWCLRCDLQIESVWEGLENAWSTSCPECGFYVRVNHNGETWYADGDDVPEGCLLVLKSKEIF